MLLRTGAGVGTVDSDYAYIDIFIGFLERIINIIKNLFSGATKDDAAEGENE